MVSIIQGASRGIGLELVRQLLARGERVVATCRRPQEALALADLAARDPALRVLSLDVTDEASVAHAAQALDGERARLLMNVSGLLHDGDLGPEKRLADVDPAQLARVFAVNAYGPLLVAKHFAPLLVHGERAVLANVSARASAASRTTASAAGTPTARRRRRRTCSPGTSPSSSPGARSSSP
ncbi:MAG: hypothetical protein SangKO_030150 [Sandaracinaceae bacterium]